MKNILILIFCLITKITYSQKVEYPIIKTDELGNKLVIMTFEQASILDNKTEQLRLYKKYKTFYKNCSDMVSALEKEIINKDKYTLELKTELGYKNEQLGYKDNIIIGYKAKNDIYNEEIKNREEYVSKQEREIKRLKNKIIVGGIGGGVVITTLILLNMNK